jgi:hypothetical protein
MVGLEIEGKRWYAEYMTFRSKIDNTNLDRFLVQIFNHHTTVLDQTFVNVKVPHNRADATLLQFQFVGGNHVVM